MQAEACAALKSGTYRVVDGSQGMDVEPHAQIDAEALRIGLPGLGSGTVPLTNEGRCSFSFPDARGAGRLPSQFAATAVELQRRVGLDLPGLVVYAGLAPTIYLGISVLQP